MDGELVGDYEIVRTIGGGGNGIVFEARHRRLNKRFALKRVSPSHPDYDEIVRRFASEGETAARVSHPNAVDVSHVGLDDVGAPFLVMEYLEGEDLEQRLARETRLSGRDTVDVLLPAIAAVAAAHDAGVVHRDLKPANIFLSRRAKEVVPKVVDFGISKVLPEGRSGTSGTMIIGTPPYIAPEALNGWIDARVDQFALGVILYRALTGQSPFRGETVHQVLYAVGFVPPIPPRAIVPDLSADLEAVVLKTLEKDPEQRFPDVRALGRALLPFASERVRLTVDLDVPEPPAEAQRHRPAPSPIFDATHPNASRSLRTPVSAWVSRATGVSLHARAVRRWPSVAVLAGALLLAVVVMKRGLIEPPSSEVRGGDGATSKVVESAAHAALGSHEVVAATFEVDVKTEPADAQLTLDGVPAGSGSLRRRLPVDGAEHVIGASAPGHGDITIRFRDRPPPPRLTLPRLSSGH